jgi:hypothetical protein
VARGQAARRIDGRPGLTQREYQAWTTLTIAQWRRLSPPPLDKKKPWFKISGRPGDEKVGYLEQLKTRKKKARQAS